jgi:hypothetical protein
MLSRIWGSVPRGNDVKALMDQDELIGENPQHTEYEFNSNSIINWSPEFEFMLFMLFYSFIWISEFLW